MGSIIAVNEVFFSKQGHHGLMITFGAKVIGGEITIKDKNEIPEVKWVDIDTANNLMPYHPGGVESLSSISFRSLTAT